MKYETNASILPLITLSPSVKRVKAPKHRQSFDSELCSGPWIESSRKPYNFMGGTLLVSMKPTRPPLRDALDKIINECDDVIKQLGNRGASATRSFPGRVAQRLSLCNNRCRRQKTTTGENCSDLLGMAATNSSQLMRLPAKRKKIVIKTKREVGGIAEEILKKLFEARCEDLHIQATAGQETRFLDYCAKAIQESNICLTDSRLGTRSMKVLSAVFRDNFNFSVLNLSNNNIGYSGLQYLCDSLKENQSLYLLNLAGNSFTPECIALLFNTLQDHPTITSLDLSNPDQLRKNRMGTKGCMALSDFLQKNRILTFLNIAENSIGPDGLKHIIKGISGNHVLLSLNLSNNNLPSGCIYSLSGALLKSGIIELYLKHNDLNDQSMDDLAMLIYKKSNKLERIDVSHNKITSVGASHIFRALTDDAVVIKLNLSSNDFKEGEVLYLKEALHKNKKLQYLNLSECKIGDGVAKDIADGLDINAGLKALILSNNLIGDIGSHAIGSSLTKNKALLELDLAGNLIGKFGCEGIANGIEMNLVIEGVNLCNNKLYDDEGRRLFEAISGNTQIKRVKLGMNSINIRCIEEIEAYLRKNVERSKVTKREEMSQQYRMLRRKTRRSCDIEKEMETIRIEKEKLKREIQIDLKILNDALSKENKEEDQLKMQLDEFVKREKDIEQNIRSVEQDMLGLQRTATKEFSKRQRHIAEKIESTSIAQKIVDTVKDKYKDKQFQYRIEVGEITAALKGFRDKKELWESIVKGKEQELAKLKDEITNKCCSENLESAKPLVIRKRQKCACHNAINNCK